MPSRSVSSTPWMHRRGNGSHHRHTNYRNSISQGNFDPTQYPQVYMPQPQHLHGPPYIDSNTQAIDPLYYGTPQPQHLHGPPYIYSNTQAIDPLYYGTPQPQHLHGPPYIYSNTQAIDPMYYGTPQPQLSLTYISWPYIQDANMPWFYNIHAQPLPMYISQTDADICNALLAQIEYYFSDENLENDSYLKGKMDEDGWVSVFLISGFKRVKRLTSDIHQILRALQPSSVVQVGRYKLRKRGTWRAWIPVRSLPSSPHPAQDELVVSMESLQLGGES